MKHLILIIAVLLFCNKAFAQVGIGTTNPKSTLDINGTLSVKHVSLVGSAMPTPIVDGVYISISPTCEACVGSSPSPITNQEFQLPDPDEFPGRIYILRNINNEFDADITIDPASTAEFFAGDSTNSSGTRITMATTAGGDNRTKTLIFISDGDNWTYGILGF